jgi:hypothetical protein
MIQHSVTAAAITDGLIFMAVVMLLTRTLGMVIRAKTVGPVDNAHRVQPAALR